MEFETNDQYLLLKAFIEKVNKQEVRALEIAKKPVNYDELAHVVVEKWEDPTTPKAGHFFSVEIIWKGIVVIKEKVYIKEHERDELFSKMFGNILHMLFVGGLRMYDKILRDRSADNFEYMEKAVQKVNDSLDQFRNDFEAEYAKYMDHLKQGIAEYKKHHQ